MSVITQINAILSLRDSQNDNTALQLRSDSSVVLREQQETSNAIRTFLEEASATVRSQQELIVQLKQQLVLAEGKVSALTTTHSAESQASASLIQTLRAENQTLRNEKAAVTQQLNAIHAEKAAFALDQARRWATYN